MKKEKMSTAKLARWMRCLMQKALLHDEARADHLVREVLLLSEQKRGVSTARKVEFGCEDMLIASHADG
jgi:hypothetical protein